jgi:hypothetical protein
MMMLGREIGLPAELMFGSPGNTGQPERDQYVGELQTAIEGANRVARETLKHFPEQRGLKIPPLISEYLEWAPKSRKELIHRGSCRFLCTLRRQGDALYPRSWDQYLPLLAGALRSSVNRSTEYTPNMMMLGREIGLPAELMFGSPGNTGQNS